MVGAPIGLLVIDEEVVLQRVLGMPTCLVAHTLRRCCVWSEAGGFVVVGFWRAERPMSEVNEVWRALMSGNANLM